MSVNVIRDAVRLDELTEWCRNKPEDAAMRIMVAEGLCSALSGGEYVPPTEQGPKREPERPFISKTKAFYDK